MINRILFLFLVLSSLTVKGQAVNLNEGGFTNDTYFIEIPFQYIHNKIIVEIEINYKKRKFILDTGVPLVISEKLFHELNCTVISKQQVTDINQIKDSLLFVRTDSLKIGNYFLTGLPAIVLHQHEMMDCFGVDGFIGSNVFRNSVIQFDFERKIVIITESTSSLNLSLADGSDLMLDRQSSPYLKIKIGKKITEFALFDSGADEFYSMSTQKMRKSKKTKEFNVIAQAYGSNAIGMTGRAIGYKTFLMFIPSITLSGSEIIDIISESSEDVNSRIGSRMIEYGKLTIDYKNRKYFFTAYDSVIKYRDNQFQVSLNYLDNQFCIGKVWDKQLSKKIKFGDKIISINDINVEKIPLCDAISLTKSARKSTFTIGVKKQNNEILKLEIKEIELQSLKQ